MNAWLTYKQKNKQSTFLFFQRCILRMRLLFYGHKFVTVRARATRASLVERKFQNQDLCCV